MAERKASRGVPEAPEKSFAPQECHQGLPADHEVISVSQMYCLQRKQKEPFSAPGDFRVSVGVIFRV